MRQNFAGKRHPIFYNIWDPVVDSVQVVDISNLKCRSPQDSINLLRYLVICSVLSSLDFYRSCLTWFLHKIWSHPISDTWTSAWDSPCWSPSSPWSTDQCPGSAGPLHFFSYSGELFHGIFMRMWRYEDMMEMLFSSCSGCFHMSISMRIWWMHGLFALRRRFEWKP